MLVSFLIINTHCPLLLHQPGQIDRWASNFFFHFLVGKLSLISPGASQQLISDLKSGLSDPTTKLLATGILPRRLTCHIGVLCD